MKIDEIYDSLYFSREIYDNYTSVIIQKVLDKTAKTYLHSDIVKIIRRNKGILALIREAVNVAVSNCKNIQVGQTAIDEVINNYITNIAIVTFWRIKNNS